uniref:Caspase family p20 domain-containing protein n=2 Tax=Anopheles atroparvus TaxID=41427 RepID=A0A182IX30_ANOAO
MSGSGNFEDEIDAMIARELDAAMGRPTDRVRQNSNTQRRTNGNEASGEKYDLSKNAFVLVLHHYEYNSGKVRMGSKVDMEKIKGFFDLYRTEPNGGLEVHDNLTLRQVRQLMDTVSQKDFSHCSCLIVIIMSHGDQDDTILAQDDKHYSLHEDVLEKVAINVTLANKPKLFIVNACRGSAVVTDAVTFRFDNSDMVIFQSTYEGHVSYRSTVSGSFFLQEFFDLLRENDHLNICELSTMLNSRAVERR